MITRLATLSATHLCTGREEGSGNRKECIYRKWECCIICVCARARGWIVLASRAAGRTGGEIGWQWPTLTTSERAWMPALSLAPKHCRSLSLSRHIYPVSSSLSLSVTEQQCKLVTYQPRIIDFYPLWTAVPLITTHCYRRRMVPIRLKQSLSWRQRFCAWK